MMVGDELFTLQKRDCLYVGKEINWCLSKVYTRNFLLIILSQMPAHRDVPTALMKAADAMPVDMGSPEKATLEQFINTFMPMALKVVS